MGTCKIANISEMASHRAKRSEIWAQGVVYEVYVQFVALWPYYGQVSCPNMAGLKISPYLGNRCPLSKNKLNFDPLG